MAFKKGNIPWNKGRKLSDEESAKLDTTGLDLGHKEGREHHLWKGDRASYSAIHYWVARKLGKAINCSNCGSSRRCVWANISGEYRRDVNDYKSLCYSCHFYFDNVGERMWETRKEVVSV